jgi:hypothetical protein
MSFRDGIVVFTRDFRGILLGSVTCLSMLVIGNHRNGPRVTVIHTNSYYSIAFLRLVPRPTSPIPKASIRPVQRTVLLFRRLV